MSEQTYKEEPKNYDIIDAHEFHIAVISSQWHAQISDKLYAGSLKVLQKYSCIFAPQHDRLQVAGAFEIIQLAKILLDTNKYHGIIALGTIIKGNTPHFDHLANCVTNQLAKINIPVGFGILAVNNFTQAKERSMDNNNNKGYQATLALLSLLTQKKKIERYHEEFN